jgi:hypothetical protein
LSAKISLGISLVSLIGLVGQIGFGFIRLISLGNLIVISWPYGFIGFSLIGLVGLSALSACQLIGLIGFVIAAKTISRRLKQAGALGVATLQSSATEIVNVAFYYFASSSLHVYSLVKEMMLWWLALAKKKMWRWIASFGESYHDDVYSLQKNYYLSGFC